MLLKRRADLLIDEKYRRITIWDALDWKQNRPIFGKNIKITFIVFVENRKIR